MVQAVPPELLPFHAANALTELTATAERVGDISNSDSPTSQSESWEEWSYDEVPLSFPSLAINVE